MRISQAFSKCQTCMVLLLIYAAVSSCTWLQKLPPAGKSTPASEIELKFWRTGMHAFQRADYAEALKSFETIRHVGRDENLRRRALYAFACTRLILAEDESELDEAMELWRGWSDSIKKDMDHEDPRMLMPILKNVKFAQLQLAAKELIDRAERDQKFQERLIAKDKEIEKLKSQLEELESIHLETEEKKKELSSP